MQSLDTEGFPYEAEVNLTLVDKDRIHEINREMRQIEPTDGCVVFSDDRICRAGRFRPEWNISLTTA